VAVYAPDPVIAAPLKIIRALQDPAREPEAYADLVSTLLERVHCLRDLFPFRLP
jgi:hypothetical protein